jgi:hypothetical protein
VFPVRYELKFDTSISFEKKKSVFNPRVEAGSNTSTVALRVEGDGENRTQCLGV